MINREKLKEKMFFSKKNAFEVSDYLNISTQCFYNKLNLKTEFTETEIDKLVKLFGEELWETTNN